tara:strand:- start:721 stop:1005 length:285 start_codon:yes stop_codon:yes gene_type:complete
MNNKLKLFYISTIGILLIVIYNLTIRIEAKNNEMMEQIEIHNRVVMIYQGMWRETLKESNVLKLSNKRLKHDVDSMLDENLTLKNLLDSSATNP